MLPATNTRAEKSPADRNVLIKLNKAAGQFTVRITLLDQQLGAV